MPRRPITALFLASPVRRVLRRLRRSPLAWWVLALAAGVITTVEVAAFGTDADAARDAWGRPVAVVVAVRSLDVGDVVAAGDIATTQWPEPLVPPGAVATSPVGRVVTAAVLGGEAIVDTRLAPSGLRGPAALLPPGHRGIAVPLAAAPPIDVGDRVDVLATFDVIDAGTAPTDVVVSDVIVVGVDDTGIVIAVPAGAAPRVAFAVARGTVTLVLRGAG